MYRALAIATATAMAVAALAVLAYAAVSLRDCLVFVNMPGYYVALVVRCGV